MGNTPMTIGLNVDNGNNGGIMAGSILYGRIYLSVKKEGTVNARSIRLKVIGTEEAVVEYERSEEAVVEHEDNFERSSDTIYSIDHIIKEFPSGVIPKGQFEFPFALQLPKSLPSSMKAKSSQSTCEVRYEVVAEVFQRPNSLFSTNPYAKEKLTVVAMPPTIAPDHDSSLQLPVEIVPISNCRCCCSFSCTRIGTMALETKFDKTTLLLDASPGTLRNKRTPPYTFRSEDNYHPKSFGVQFRCQNKSTARVKSVRAQLTETIEWSVNGHTKTIKTILATSTKDASLYPELDAMRRKPFRFEEHRQGSEMNLLLEHTPLRTIDPPLVVPAAKATDTYRGAAVQVRHVLGLFVVTEGCCSTNPDASALVKLYRSPVAYGAPTDPTESEANDPLFCKPPTHETPSAPFEDEPFATDATPSDAFFATSRATAPPSVYDNPHDGYNSYTNYSTSATSEVPIVEAQLVLPEDWNAQTAEMVTISIAEAMVLDTSFDASGGQSK